MKATLDIFEMESQYNMPNYWAGECDAIKMQGNNIETKGIMVEFRADTRQELIDIVIAKLQSRGLTGRLKIIG